jgi:hypothetical protein
MSSFQRDAVASHQDWNPPRSRVLAQPVNGTVSYDGLQILRAGVWQKASRAI